LERAGYKIISAIFTSNEEGYCGDRIITVDAKTDNDVNNWR
jgi:TPP-dependent 2-oxoacid decarboxylase